MVLGLSVVVAPTGRPLDMKLTCIALVLCACAWLAAGDVAHVKAAKAKLIGRIAAKVKHHKRGILSAVPPYKLGHDIPVVTHSVVKPLVVSYPPTAAVTAVKVPLTHPLISRYPVPVGHKVPVPHPHYGLKFPHHSKTVLLPKPDHHFHHHHHHVEPKPVFPIVPAEPLPATPLVPVPQPTATIAHPVPVPPPTPVIHPAPVLPAPVLPAPAVPVPVAAPVNHVHLKPVLPGPPVPLPAAPVVSPVYPIAQQIPYILRPGGAVQTSVFAQYPRYAFNYQAPFLPFAAAGGVGPVLFDRPQVPPYHLVPQGGAHNGVVFEHPQPAAPVPVEPNLLHPTQVIPQPAVHLQPGQAEVHLHQPQPDLHFHPGQPEVHYHPGQPEVHLQPGQPEVHLHQGQPEIHLQPGQQEVHLHHGQPEVHFQPGQPELHLQPVQPGFHLHPGQPGVLQSGQPELHLQPGQPEFHLQPGQAGVHYHQAQPDYHLQPGQQDVHYHSGQPELHLQPGQYDIHGQQGNTDVHVQPGQTDINYHSGQPDVHLQPQPGFNLQPGQPDLSVQPLQPNVPQFQGQPGFQIQPSQPGVHQSSVPLDHDGWNPVQPQAHDFSQGQHPEAQYPQDGHHQFTQEQGTQVFEQHAGDEQYDYQHQLQHHIQTQIEQGQYDQNYNNHQLGQEYGTPQPAQEYGQPAQDFNFAQQPSNEYGVPQAEGRSSEGEGEQQRFHNHIPLGLQPPLDRPLDHFR
ncbi:glutenin, high molecular weight subunit PW212 [Manduca sexta]|uniref:glutenin, high molecular weight subunit PW212 n=1 Tax=Manduca sexta TaxID=7130 RepID=UPI00188E40F2|nr:glutenin, high molecular weight subunit PW212 [Manduca sexta]